ncbi:hypothetical protein BLOT_014328 [Blomia tropicalis]|nr:hypothetical protein BLOT_014328 [Blomia tropicalis]
MDSFVFTSFYHDTHDNVWHMLIILNPSSTTTRASDILLILSLNSSISIKTKNQNIQLRTILVRFIVYHRSFTNLLIMFQASMTKIVDQLFYFESFWYV